MVAPEAPDNESLRLELQEALVTYRQLYSSFTQTTGILAAADVALLSYAFSQRIAIILLAGGAFPIFILVSWIVTGSQASPLINLVLRIERRLRIRKDSLGVTLAGATTGKMIPAVGSHIEDLNDEGVRHLTLKWEPRWSAIPIVLYTASAVQLGLFALSLTVFHYQFM